MRVKDIVIEDFVNYKEPSLFIATCFCDYKCCIEQGLNIGTCQNAPLDQYATQEFSNKQIYDYYINNQITSAIVVGGKEPFMQFDELYDLIRFFRKYGINDYFIIYTGYNADEIQDKITTLKNFENIIIKFGRYIPNQKSHYDEILGVNLASDNQYAKIIS